MTIKTPEEIAADFMKRCWWRSEDHLGEERPEFKGLDTEIIEIIIKERVEAYLRGWEEARQACISETCVSVPRDGHEQFRRYKNAAELRAALIALKPQGETT